MTLKNNILLKLISVYIAFGIFLLASSCNSPSERPQLNEGAIILGDSSTIVTETDSQYLKNNIAEINPKQFIRKAVASVVDSTPKPKKNPDQDKLVAPSREEPTGFTIDFGKGVKLTFSGISTREFKEQFPQKASGVSYAITSGNLTESKMILSGLKDVTIKQRYQTHLLLESGSQKLSLQNIGGYLSDWKALKTENSSGNMIASFADLSHLGFKKVSHQTIRNGVRRAARSSRMSQKETDEWLQRIRHTRSAQDAPCSIELDNTQWQIYGTTSDGQRFFKVVRLDILSFGSPT